MSTDQELLFPLLATLPQQFLSACYLMQPRPEWEKQVSWFSVPFWLIVLISIVFTVFVQTKFFSSSSKSTSMSYINDHKLPVSQATGGRVFDLSDITRSVHSALSKRIMELRNQRSVCVH